jgi:hypothetical protein
MLASFGSSARATPARERCSNSGVELHEASASWRRRGIVRCRIGRVAERRAIVEPDPKPEIVVENVGHVLCADNVSTR